MILNNLNINDMSKARKIKELQNAVGLLLIAIKEGECIVYPGNDSNVDYIQILEDSYKAVMSPE